MTWRDIEGYRFHYQINQDGEVRRVLPDGTFQTLKPWMMRGGGGSSSVQLFVKIAVIPEGHKSIPVVRLMEGRFIRRRRPGEVISYRNGIHSDCSAKNLYHTTYSILNRKLRNHNDRSVEKIGPNGEILDLYVSVAEAAKKNFVSKSCVIDRCMNRRKNPFKSFGFSFRYEERRR